MVTEERRARWRFFQEWAGYATPPGRAACALELARAEELLDEAERAGVALLDWQDDPEPWDPGDAANWPRDEVQAKFASGEWVGPFGAVLTVNGEHVASLWGIVVGSQGIADPYCRVVGAELAAEALDELQQATGDARDAARVDAFLSDPTLRCLDPYCSRLEIG